MPETPSKADAFVSSADNLAAYLADGEIENSGEAKLAGQAGRATQDTRWTSKDSVAKGASKNAWLLAGFHGNVRMKQ